MGEFMDNEKNYQRHIILLSMATFEMVNKHL